MKTLTGVVTMRFKTLRDFQRAGIILNKNKKFTKKNIRREAVKWYKHLKKVKSEHDVFDFIETFFNLTEEDLKKNGK